MTIEGVTVYVKTTRGVEYAYKTVWNILRKEKKDKIRKAIYLEFKKTRECRRHLKKIVYDCLFEVKDPVIGFPDEFYWVEVW